MGGRWKRTWSAPADPMGPKRKRHLSTEPNPFDDLSWKLRKGEYKDLEKKST